MSASLRKRPNFVLSANAALCQHRDFTWTRCHTRLGRSLTPTGLGFRIGSTVWELTFFRYLRYLLFQVLDHCWASLVFDNPKKCTCISIRAIVNGLWELTFFKYLRYL